MTSTHSNVISAGCMQNSLVVTAHNHNISCLNTNRTQEMTHTRVGFLLSAHELERGEFDEHVKVDVKMRAPEATCAAPDLGGEAGTGDAVEDTSNRAPGQLMLAAVNLNKCSDVTARIFLLCAWYTLKSE